MRKSKINIWSYFYSNYSRKYNLRDSTELFLDTFLVKNHYYSRIFRNIYILKYTALILYSRHAFWQFLIWTYSSVVFLARLRSLGDGLKFFAPTIFICSGRLYIVTSISLNSLWEETAKVSRQICRNPN